MGEPQAPKQAAFEDLIDLAAEKVGGTALLASDEFFAAKENLLKPGRGVFIPDRYTENGKWMDGWESRRKRTPGHDFCVIKLGLAGTVRGVDVDTNHFLGNAPAACSIEVSRVPEHYRAEIFAGGEVSWTEILPRSPLKPGSQNLFSIASAREATHLRLNIFPDGGVARFKVYGDVAPDWERLRATCKVVDLAAVEHGGLVVAASDSFFSDRRNLIMPGRPTTMGDAWETKRRRGPGYDWSVVRLGKPGRLVRVEVDTTHFKGNFPESCSLEGSRDPAALDPSGDTPAWTEILPRIKLEAHTRHTFEQELEEGGPFTHVRLNIFPDGGVARLRLHGVPEEWR
jgi:allantoicase